jgi:hypothetical protein
MAVPQHPDPARSRNREVARGRAEIVVAHDP